MNVERAGSIVKDLREALQDVVAPDLKAVVRGLSDVKDSVSRLETEMREGNKLLREEMQKNDLRLREEMHQRDLQLREEMEKRDARLRGDIQAGNYLLRDEMAKIEIRTAERIDHAGKLADLNRRYEEVLRENQQLRRPQPEQQH